MKLYVGNATRQILDLTCRIPDVVSIYRQKIPVGCQVLVASGQLNTPQIDAVIDQLAVYGLVRIDEIDRTKPFIGMCYSVDKPIPNKRLILAMDHNIGVLTERGKTMRKEAAVVTSLAIEKQLREEGLGNLDSLDVSVVEEARKGGPDNPAPIAEGVIVSRSVEAAKVARSKSDKRAARAH